MTTDELLRLYRTMTLIRQCQEAVIREYPSDEIKTPVHLGIGLEGISAGVCFSLPPSTKSFGQLRNHGQYLALTGETDAYFLELYGKRGGTGGGKAGSMHLASPAHGLLSTSGIVGSTIPLAVGAALAHQRQGNDAPVVAMFGDAAVEEGEFWESLNFACLHRLRVLFVCEDNDLAIHTPGKDRRGFATIRGAVSSFRCWIGDADGTDVRQVEALTTKAIVSIDKFAMPAVLVFRWTRLLEHVGPNTDWHIGYRDQPTEAALREADPVWKYEQFLTQTGLGKELARIWLEVHDQVEASVARAKAAPYPERADLLTHVYASSSHLPAGRLP